MAINNVFYGKQRDTSIGQAAELLHKYYSNIKNKHNH